MITETFPKLWLAVCSSCSDCLTGNLGAKFAKGQTHSCNELNGKHTPNTASATVLVNTHKSPCTLTKPPEQADSPPE